ncbi:Hypothetical predicted protein [Paramuricea clavata]|uniref:Uncharacterized protein n=2 Tax=Paramuricea clavata TaxID=317549 RepID=A0A6S7HF25_PARCT|nr:Hypothetical predicted protein [Paramuricea clavata]
MAAGSGSRWTEAETKSLLDAYGEQIIQEAIDGMATNKFVYDEISRILKEHSNIDRTTSQIETKIKKLRSGYSKLKDRMKQSGSERPYFSSALPSVEKTALKVWEQLDRILGPRPVQNPPEEQLFESGTQQVEQCDDVDAALDMSEDEQSASASNPQKREKKIVEASRSKKACLSDVIEKLNEQMGNITNLIASSIVSPEVREKERKTGNSLVRCSVCYPKP